MSGICGFLRSGVPGEAVGDYLDSQVQRLCRFDGSNPKTIVSGHAGIAVSPLSGAGAVSRRGNLIAGIQGKFEWLDEELAEIQRSRDAAEALLIGWERHQTRVLEKLSGSFSLALVDEAREIVFVATDRLGIEPVRYSVSGKEIAFASDEAALSTLPFLSLNADPQAILHYLYFHQVPSPLSVYKNVERLMPGEYLEFSNGRPQCNAYWSPKFIEDSTSSRSDLSDSLVRILTNSVKQNAMGTTTGCFLSGGLDSSTVTGLLSKQSASSVKSFSIGFAEPGYDEMDYARTTAKHFGTNQIEYYVTPEDVVRAVPKVAALYGAPFGNSSAIPVYYCAKLAADNGMTRLLAGDGGDELFGGNQRYAHQKLLAYYHGAPHWIRERFIEPSLARVTNDSRLWPLRKLKSYVNQARLRLPDRLESYNVLLELDPSRLLNPEFVRQIDVDEPRLLQKEWFDRIDADHVLNRILGLDLKLTLADNDIPKVSGMCELAGIDVAYPFLSDELVEFALALPVSLKVRFLELRYFFKKSFADFLPTETITKKKQGFGLPIGVWLARDPELSEMARESVRSLINRGVLHSSSEALLFEHYLERHAHHFGTMIWLLLMLDQWYRNHLDD